jgi:hypothetical protein
VRRNPLNMSSMRPFRSKKSSVGESFTSHAVASRRPVIAMAKFARLVGEFVLVRLEDRADLEEREGFGSGCSSRASRAPTRRGCGAGRSLRARWDSQADVLIDATRRLRARARSCDRTRLPASRARRAGHADAPPTRGRGCQPAAGARLPCGGRDVVVAVTAGNFFEHVGNTDDAFADVHAVEFGK